MKKKVTWILAMMLTAAVVLSGCAKGAVDGTATVMTMDDSVKIPLGEYNLMLRYEQAKTESLYVNWGYSLYDQEMGDGQTYGEYSKENMLENFKRMYALEAVAADYGVEVTEEEQAAIAEAASKFLSDNSDKVKNLLGASKEQVEHVLRLYTLDAKMYELLTADVDTEVSDEEAAQKRISYIFTSNTGSETDENGELVPLTEDEVRELKINLNAIAEEAVETGDFKTAASKYNLSASEITYGEDSSSPTEVVREAADKLKDGECSEIIEGESGYYLVYMVSNFDEEATENKKESIVTSRKEAMFEEAYTPIVEAHSFTVEESVLEALTFERTYLTNDAQ